MTLPLKRIVVCSHCGQRVPPPSEVEKLPTPEFRTDHSSECVCGACVYRRWDSRRRSLAGAARGGLTTKAAP